MNTPGPSPTETLMGGLDFTAVHLHSITEQVFIRQLPVDELPQYLAFQDDEEKMIELVCRKERGWTRTLEPASFENLIQEVERVNADFFTSLAGRQDPPTPKPVSRSRKKDEQPAVTLADFIAEVCVVAKLAIPQARQHSLAQLRLMQSAAHRLQASEGLIYLDTHLAAAAASMSKQGYKANYEPLRKLLIESAEGNK